jgi:peptidylprolyl isomerase
MIRLLLRGALFAVALYAASPVQAAPSSDDILYMDLAFGRVVITMRPDLAPATCAHIRALVKRGFYDGLTFHRVIDGFMAQTGDPTGTGTGGSGHPIKAEFSNSAKFTRGVVGMARTSDPNSGDSQFFIMYAAAPQLDGKYTIWGEVTAGMEAVDQLRKGDSAKNGVVANPDKIIRMQVATDAVAAQEKADTPASLRPK